MRIALLTHEFSPYPGGIGTYAYEIAAAAAELGHDVTVLAPNYGDPQVHQNEKFNFVGFSGENYAPYLMPLIIWRTWRFLRRESFDIIHAADLPHAIALSILRWVISGKLIATCYGTELGTKLFKIASSIPATNPFTNMDHVIAISQFSKNLLRAKTPKPSTLDVRVVSLGISQKWLKTSNNSDVILFSEKYGLPRDTFIIGALGRIDPRKGHEVAIQVLEHLPQSVAKQCCYLVVGKTVDKALHNRLHGLAKKSKVQVIFSGPIPQEELQPAMQACDIFFLPCQNHPIQKEGFGLVFIEASASGLPIITTNVDAIPDVVKQDINGFLFEPDDLVSMSRAIVRLFRDKKLRQTLSVSARQFSRKFTWESCARKTYGPAQNKRSEN